MHVEVNDRNIYLLLDAVDQNCHSGTFEDTWLDLSGNSRHATRPTSPNTTGNVGVSGNPDQDIPRFTRDGLEFYGLNANGKFTFASAYSITNTSNGITVLATIKTTSTKSTTSSSADAGLNILGDTGAGVIFGFGIELAQAFSNRISIRLIGKPIHGRFDIEDIRYNIKGLFWGSLAILFMLKIKSLFDKR